jgi:hypothetical protein
MMNQSYIFQKRENIIPISCILMLLVKIKEGELALLLATDKGDHLVSRAMAAGEGATTLVCWC